MTRRLHLFATFAVSLSLTACESRPLAPEPLIAAHVSARIVDESGRPLSVPVWFFATIVTPSGECPTGDPLLLYSGFPVTADFDGRVEHLMEVSQLRTTTATCLTVLAEPGGRLALRPDSVTDVRLEFRPIGEAPDTALVELSLPPA